MINDNREKAKEKYEKAKEKYDQTEKKRDIALGRRDKARKVYNQWDEKCHANNKNRHRAEKDCEQAKELLESVKNRQEWDHESRDKFYNVLKILEEEADKAVIKYDLANEHRDWTEAKATIAIDRYNEDKEASDGRPD